MIKLKDLSVGYGDNSILNNINIEIPKGSITSILGPNGSGKTTLLSTLMKLIPPLKGKIYIDEKDIFSLSQKEMSKIISLVPQFHMPKFDYSVLDIILTGRTPYISYLPKPKDIEKVNSVINMLEINDLKDKKYTKLSGGQRQLVLIARSIAQDTPVIVFDEPTSALDLKNQIKVLKLIKKLNVENKKTCIMTLHDPNSAAVFSDNIMLVNNEKVEFGSVHKIITQDNLKKVYDIDCSVINHNGNNLIIPNYN